jgi:hypothetical protein
MATEENRKRSEEGGPTGSGEADTRPESGDTVDSVPENQPNAEVKRQIDTGEENAA